jgi:uncharacterized protein (TIGR02996 family)
MVIVVAEHDAGWKFHVPVERSVVTVGRARDNDIVIVDPSIAKHHAQLEVSRATGPVRFGEFTLVFEHHHDPTETSLLAAIAGGDDPSRLVYADWLEQQGCARHAEMLRTQIEILQHAAGEPAFAALSERLRALIAMLPYGWCAHVERPVIELGDRIQLAFRIGLASRTTSSRVVEIWAAGVELTSDDDSVFVPAFGYALDREIQRIAVRRGLPYPELDIADNHRRVDADEDVRDAHRWLQCGPTTDNLSSYLFGAGEDVILTFAFWRLEHPRPHELGQVFVVRMPERELSDRLRQVIEILDRGA